MTVVEFFYPREYEVMMFAPHKGFPGHRSVAIYRIIQLAISIAVFVQQGFISSNYRNSGQQEYLDLVFYSQIFQFISYAILIIEAFIFPKVANKITNAYQSTKHTHILTLVAHGLYEIAWVGFYIGVIEFLITIVPQLSHYTSGCQFFLCNTHLIFFVLMTVDLAMSRIHFIASHIIYGLVWMTVYDIINCSLNNSLKQRTFGSNIAYCIALDFMFASFHFLATSYQNWKLGSTKSPTDVITYEEVTHTDQPQSTNKTYEEVLLKIGSESDNSNRPNQNELPPQENETKV